MVHKPLRLVISDIGDVYVRWHGVISRICQIYGLPKEEFTSWYLNGFATMLYEGILPIEEFWKTVNITYHDNVTGDPFTTYFDGTPIKGMERVFKALKAHGIRLVSASNTYAPNWDVCFRYADMSVFSAHYPSHLLHLAKPSQEYFHAVLDKERVTPALCLFIDDREENIKGAQEAGIPSYQYLFSEDPDATNLEAFLNQRYGFTPPLA